MREKKRSRRARKDEGTERNLEKEEYPLEKQVSEEKRGKKRRHEKNLTDGEGKKEGDKVKPSPRVPGVCPVCGKSFTRKNRVPNHMKLVHSSFRCFPCPGKRCAYVGKTKSDLVMHLQMKVKLLSDAAEESATHS